MDDPTTELLDRLLERILYFGRAETFCRMRRLAALPDGVQPNTILTEKDRGGMNTCSCFMAYIGISILKRLLATTDSETLKGRSMPSGTAWHYAALPQATYCYACCCNMPPRFPDDLNCVQFAVGGRVYPPLARWVKVTERFRGRVLKQLSVQITGDHRTHYDLLTSEQKEELALLSGKDGEGHPIQGHLPRIFRTLAERDWYSEPSCGLAPTTLYVKGNPSVASCFRASHFMVKRCA